MKIVLAEKIDSVADYRIVERETPRPGEGDVLLKIAVCGMGYVDALVALGKYQVKPPVPFTPGGEIAATVEAVGAGVVGIEVGDRVLASSFGGGLAEYIVVPASAVTKIPDTMTLAQAATFQVNYVTALHALKDRANIAEGERLLVLGAAGGVGTAAVELGKLMGAEVAAVASTEEKRVFATRNGADAVVDTSPDGWRDRVKAAFGGNLPDVIFDPVCGPLFELGFRSLAWRGRHLVVGFAGGPIPVLPVNLTLMKGASLIGVDVRQFLLFEPDLATRHLAELLGWVGDGKLSPPVGLSFAFDDFAGAMEYAISGQGLGKTVIRISDED